MQPTDIEQATAMVDGDGDDRFVGGTSPAGAPVVEPGDFRVLVVEDTDLLRGALARALEGAGYAPVTADSGHQAMELLRSQRFDAAIVDRHVPGPDGLQLLAELSERQPYALRVLVSGSLDLGTAMAAVNEGHVDHVFEKPLRVRDLLKHMARSIESSRRLRGASPVVSAKELAQRRDLAQCFEQDLLSLALQPIVGPEGGAARAYEVLLRSSHATLSNPGLVIAAAERWSQMGKVTRLVARKAAGCFEHLSAEQLLFVNLHPTDLEQPEALLESLEPLGPHAHRVVLEITERSALGQRWRECLPMLRRQGFRIAVDDAGAGYSSLSTIAEAEPEIIKVDMSIISDIDRHPPRLLLLKMLAAFAHDTGVQLVAEGVETSAEAECVRSVGSVWLQGYLLGKPMAWDQWVAAADVTAVR